MTRAGLDIHNAWCAFCASEGFAGLRRTVSERLTKALGSDVSLDVAVVDTVDWAQIERLLAAGQIAFGFEAGPGERAAAVASRLLPAKVLRLLTGSEKLSVSRSFCRAAMEILALNAAAALSDAVGTEVLVSPVPAGGSLNAASYIRFRVEVLIAGNAGEIHLFIPSRVPPDGTRFSPPRKSLTIRASAGLDLEPMDISLLGSLMPDDTVNLSTARGNTLASLRLDLGRGAFREFCIDAGGLVSGGTVTITGGGVEVCMAEVISGRRDAGQGTGGAGAPGKFLLPVRLEVLAFEIGASDLDTLSPGQVLEVRPDAGRSARMYVCGELFAEGRLERFEGFDGFRVEKIF